MKKNLHAFRRAGVIIVIASSVLAIRSVHGGQPIIELPNKLQDFFTLSLSIVVEAFPFLVLGSLLAGIVNTYISAQWIGHALPKGGFVRRAVLSMTGFLLPVCECGNVPLARALLIRGLKPSEAMTFLLAAPVFNPVTIWSTYVAFSYDKTIVIARVIATLLIANIVGFVLSRRLREQDFLTKDFQAVCSHDAEQSKNVSWRTKAGLFRLSELFAREAFAMFKVLCFGALVAGTVQSFVPRELLVGVGSNVVLSVLAMLLLAFVVSICANVDAFFALSFATTFTAGSIVSFLVFGPMIDIKMLALLKTTFTTRTLATITVLSLALSAVTGLVVTYAF